MSKTDFNAIFLPAEFDSAHKSLDEFDFLKNSKQLQLIKGFVFEDHVLSQMYLENLNKKSR